jgi:hypothetical protein
MHKRSTDCNQTSKLLVLVSEPTNSGSKFTVTELTHTASLFIKYERVTTVHQHKLDVKGIGCSPTTCQAIQCTGKDYITDILSTKLQCNTYQSPSLSVKLGTSHVSWQHSTMSDSRTGRGSSTLLVGSSMIAHKASKSGTRGGGGGQKPGGRNLHAARSECHCASPALKNSPELP